MAFRSRVGLSDDDLPTQIRTDLWPESAQTDDTPVHKDMWELARSRPYLTFFLGLLGVVLFTLLLVWIF